MKSYFVWRRDDGHVGVSHVRPAEYKGTNGKIETYEHLGRFEHWSEAFTFMKAAREGSY